MCCFSQTLASHSFKEFARVFCTMIGPRDGRCNNSEQAGMGRVQARTTAPGTAAHALCGKDFIYAFVFICTPRAETDALLYGSLGSNSGFFFTMT